MTRGIRQQAEEPQRRCGGESYRQKPRRWPKRGNCVRKGCLPSGKVGLTRQVAGSLRGLQRATGLPPHCAADGTAGFFLGEAELRVDQVLSVGSVSWALAQGPHLGLWFFRTPQELARTWVCSFDLDRGQKGRYNEYLYFPAKTMLQRQADWGSLSLTMALA